MAEAKQKHHLISLEVQNVKRVTAVAISPKEPNGVVVITGENSAGKSSVLDAMEMALGGARSIPAEALHRGKPSGYVVLETESLVIKRTFTPKATYLDVTTKDGMSPKSPQDVLDKLCGAGLGFDPEAFSRMKPKEQVETLLRICPVKIDLNSNARDIASAEEERKLAKRELVALDARLSAQPVIDAPEKEISQADLVDEIDALRRYEDETRNIIADASEKKVVVEKWKNRVAELEGQLSIAKSRLAEVEAESITATEAMKSRVDKKPEIDALRQKFSTAEAFNAKVRQAKARAQLASDVEKKRAQVDVLQKRVEDLRQARTSALQEAKFPVQELGIDGDMLKYKGVPFEQAGRSEKMRVGCALASCANPQVRIGLIRDGSLLDEKSMQELQALAKENDMLFLIERVEDNRAGAIRIVDGTNLSEDAPAVEEKPSKKTKAAKSVKDDAMFGE